MNYKYITGQQIWWLAIEAITFGLAYGAGLWWIGVCMLASFRPDELGTPYWGGIPGLRSDTSGILAFFAVALFLTYSEFLRLRRRHSRTTAPGDYAVQWFDERSCAGSLRNSRGPGDRAGYLPLGQCSNTSGEYFEQTGHSPDVMANRGNAARDSAFLAVYLLRQYAPLS